MKGGNIIVYKDLTAKSLEAKNDIFAKIFNTLEGETQGA